MNSVLLSLIIPTYNRADTLGLTLQSIFNLKQVDNVEVIVVDNGSTDCTKAVCDRFANLIPCFKYIYEAIPGLLSGRHKGAEIASTELLAFIDDDVELSPYWLVSILNKFETGPDIKFITGPCLPKYESYPPAWLKYFWTNTSYGGRSCEWLSLINNGNSELQIHPADVWGLNFSVRREIFYELGGFHPDCIPSHLQQFQGDGETGLSNKGHLKGYKAVYIPGALLYHHVPKSRMTLEYFEKRAFYQGVCNSFFDLRKKHGLFELAGSQVKASPLQTVKQKIVSVMNRKLFSKNRALDRCEEKAELFGRMQKKEIEGYHFHQKAFFDDQKVREWVLKKDYLNYQLPGYD